MGMFIGSSNESCDLPPLPDRQRPRLHVHLTLPFWTTVQNAHPFCLAAWSTTAKQRLAVVLPGIYTEEPYETCSHVGKGTSRSVGSLLRWRDSEELTEEEADISLTGRMTGGVVRSSLDQSVTSTVWSHMVAKDSQSPASSRQRAQAAQSASGTARDGKVSFASAYRGMLLFKQCISPLFCGP